MRDGPISWEGRNILNIIAHTWAMVHKEEVQLQVTPASIFLCALRLLLTSQWIHLTHQTREAWIVAGPGSWIWTEVLRHDVSCQWTGNTDPGPLARRSPSWEACEVRDKNKSDTFKKNMDELNCESKSTVSGIGSHSELLVCHNSYKWRYKFQLNVEGEFVNI